MSPAHSRSLDGVRFFAFFAVFMHHAWQWRAGFGQLPFIKYGYWGVTVFFVLSGFLIGRILLGLRENEDVALGPKLKSFYIRRALRIFPIYYLFLLVIFILRAFALDPILPEWKFAPYWHAAYLTNVKMFVESTGSADSETHFWSLCIEEHFYLLAPLVILSVSRRSLTRICLGLWIAVAAARAYVFFMKLPGPYWVLSPMHFDTMSIGIAAAILEDQGQIFGLDRRKVIRIAMFSGLVFAILVCQQYWPPLPVLPQLYAVFVQPACAVATAGLILALWHGEPALLHRFLALRPIAYLGKISYALYLFHPFILAWMPVRWAEHGSTRHGFLALGATVLLASISWRWFEGPINALKDRFPYPAESGRRRGDGLVDDVAADGSGCDVAKLAAD